VQLPEHLLERERPLDGRGRHHGLEEPGHQALAVQGFAMMLEEGDAFPHHRLRDVDGQWP
jgi:hypothetical protein